MALTVEDIDLLALLEDSQEPPDCTDEEVFRWSDVWVRNRNPVVPSPSCASWFVSDGDISEIFHQGRWQYVLDQHLISVIIPGLSNAEWHEYLED